MAMLRLILSPLVSEIMTKMSSRSRDCGIWAKRVILQKKKELGIDGRLCAHSFRHAYATHSYENGMDLVTLQSLLGHRSLNSTTIYLHLAQPSRNATINPFDQLGGGIRG